MKATFVSLVLLATLAGCGGSAGTDLTGTVSFSDGAKLTTGTVVYTSKTNTYRAALNAEGQYQMTGVASGDYGVVIIGAVSGSGDQTEVDEETGEMKVQESGGSLIAKKYDEVSTSGLSVSVPGEYDLTVETP